MSSSLCFGSLPIARSRSLQIQQGLPRGFTAPALARYVTRNGPQKDLAFPIPSDSWKLELSQAIFDLCQTSDSVKPLLPQKTCLARVVLLP